MSIFLHYNFIITGNLCMCSILFFTKWSFGQGHLVIFESGTRLFAHYKYKYLYYSGGF